MVKYQGARGPRSPPPSRIDAHDCYYYNVLLLFSQVPCNLQVTLCDPYLSALSVRYYNKGSFIYIKTAEQRTIINVKKLLFYNNV